MPQNIEHWLDNVENAQTIQQLGNHCRSVSPVPDSRRRQSLAALDPNIMSEQRVAGQQGADHDEDEPWVETSKASRQDLRRSSRLAHNSKDNALGNPSASGTVFQNIIKTLPILPCPVSPTRSRELASSHSATSSGVSSNRSRSPIMSAVDLELAATPIRCNPSETHIPASWEDVGVRRIADATEESYVPLSVKVSVSCV